LPPGEPITPLCEVLAQLAAHFPSNLPHFAARRELLANGPVIVALAYGNISGPIQAGNEVHVNTRGSLTKIVDAGRDTVFQPGRHIATPVTTGRDGYVWTFDRYHSNIFAGRDAMVVSLGAVNAGIFAGGSGLIYAVESAIGSVTAGQYAGVVTWGTAAGPMTVTGPEGAFGWSYGDFNGFVESSAGSASLTSYDNAIGAVRGAQDASLWVVGQWVGDIDAGDDAVAVALGGFHGHAIAGASGYLVSEADITATLTAGRDVFIWAIGDISGDYQAGRDASAVTYGDFSADITADRDVTTVWTRGDLSGVIIAGRNVGTATDTGLPTGSAYPIFSYGQISADITALNPAGLTGGGRIGPIGAWGAIAGRIEAADTIHEIRSGGPVTATLIAPNVPVPSEFDSTIETDYPLPALPELVVAEILAQAAAEHGAVLATKTQVAAQIADLLADFAAQRAAAASGLADAIAQATAAVTQAVVDAAQALNADFASAGAQLAAEQVLAAADFDAMVQEVIDEEAALQDQRDEAVARRAAVHTAALAFAQQAFAAMIAADTQFEDAQAEAHADAQNANQQRSTDAFWDSLKRTLQASPMVGVYHLPPPPVERVVPDNGQAGSFWHAWLTSYRVYVWQGGTDTPLDFGDHLLNFGTKIGWGLIAVGVGGLVTLSGAPYVVAALGKVGISASACGVAGKIIGSAALAHTVTNTIDGIRRWDQMTPLQRDHFVADVGFGLVTAGLSRYAKYLYCFTSETEVHVPEGTGGVWYATGGGVFTVGLAALFVVPSTSRRKKTEGGGEDRGDAIWVPDVQNPNEDDLTWVESAQNPEALEELCDRLFQPSEGESWWNGLDDDKHSGYPLPGQVPVCPAMPAGSAMPGGTNVARAYRKRITESDAVCHLTRPAVARRRGTAAARVSSGGTRPIGPKRHRRSSTGRRPVALIGFALCLLIAACCMVQGWRVSHDTTRTIAQLRVGQKAITDAPTEALQAADRDVPMPGALRAEPLDPATWKLIRLRAMVRWDDGTWDDINVETLQPPSWLAAHEVRVGGLAPIPLDLEELGLPDVLGKVLAIEPCPPVPPGPGRVILTTVNHLNADVHELTIRDASGRQETIRTTGGHKFYSATRTAWVSATDLEPGEQLHGLGGPVDVVSRARLPGVHRVYNLTVEGDHVYHVGCSGVLVHNNRCILFRFGNEAEAQATRHMKGLVSKPGDVNNPKRILFPGGPSKPPFGNREGAYTHRIRITMKENRAKVTSWLRANAEEIPGHPDGWAIPLDKLGEFNSKIAAIDITEL
jgi:hypothetical protein